MKRQVEQLSLFGESKMIRESNAKRNSSFAARAFNCSKALVDVLDKGDNFRYLQEIELIKAKMLIKEC